MGEIFERTKPGSALQWTGERLTTDVSGQVEIEHLHRYFFARELCRGLDVLDIASGEGYGAALLAQVARSVVGVEISTEAVAHAQVAYHRPRLRFIQGDARKIPLPDSSVDAVVSFETIEHFYEHEAFVAEVKRVLRPDGFFIVSSPETEIYSANSQSSNPYHVRELTRREFGALLAGSFRHISMYAQRPMLGAAIVAEDPRASSEPLITFERRGDDRFEVDAGLPRALYLIAIASDAGLPTSRSSVYIETSDLEGQFAKSRHAAEEVDHWRKQYLHLQEQAEDWRQKLLAHHEEVENLRKQIVVAREEGLALRTDLEASVAALAASQVVAHEALRQATEFKEQLAAVFRSSSWRLTGPLRGISERHPKLASGVRAFLSRHPRIRRAAVGTLRRTWRIVTLRPGGSGQAGAQQQLPPAQARKAAEAVIAASPRPGCASRGTATAGALISERPPILWLFLGDTIDWLQSHHQVTGVGRVTTELFFASLEDRHQKRMIPCGLAPTNSGLGVLSLRDTSAYLAARTGKHTPQELLASIDLAAAPPATAIAPSPGDHVIFTGVVWTPAYLTLFKKLSACGIGFSVLVYDIIPVEQPMLVGEAHHRMFETWLASILPLASTIFVSGMHNKDNILRWAALSGVTVGAEIVPIPFGSSRHGLQERLSAPRALPPQVSSDRFVLSVGTIDRRKNQALLCRLWRRFEVEFGTAETPQLVLAGRDDLPLASIPGVPAMMEAGRILVLKELPDVELASLYDSCLFTIFPSLSEGYGLPVAESLDHGKLCVSSDLPVIREHAGDLAWYFDPEDDDAAYAVLCRALTSPAERAAAEARAASEYHPVAWNVAYRLIADTASQISRRVSGEPPSKIADLFLPGVPEIDIPNALAAAQAWCTDQNPDVSILIVNWNAGALTGQCIRQIWANTVGVRYEIIIADNGSDPGELSSLVTLGTGVRLLKLGVNRFFGEANNIAAQHAKGRYLCLLNNDAFGQPGWLQQLVDCMQAHPQAGAVGPLFLFPDGTVQEAGATVDAGGFPIRYGRGLSGTSAAKYLVPRPVDYISAATLLVDRDLFIAVGGFDMAYEPAYYEDADLCFKIRAQGREVRFEPNSKVIHIEGSAANDNPTAAARRKETGDLNRDKFLARWRNWMENAQHLADASCGAMHPATGQIPVLSRDSQKLVALYTPFALTPGGGERFLLTAASVLTEDHRVVIVTPHPYSHMRLRALGREFGIDLSRCQLMTEQEFAKAPEPDLTVVMGNHVTPPLLGRTEDCVFICQFPFPAPKAALHKGGFGNYRTVIAYSDYTRAHVLAGLSAHQMPPWPVEVVYPPVPQFAGDAGRKRAIILGVGRFFRGGHNKRHDLMISAFRALLDRTGGDVELHLAGSSTPEQLDHIVSLRQMASGLPVQFHIDVSNEALSGLYRDAAVYWHAAGLGADLTREPEAAEHFGISILEAMSAQCVPMAFNAGGPREIITHGVDGVLYSSLEELVDKTCAMLRPESIPTREAMGRAAGRRAAGFSPGVFASRLRQVITA